MNIKSSKIWLLLASLGLITSTVMCTPTVEVTPTPTLTPTSTPEPTFTPTPTLTPAPTAPGLTFTPTPTPTVLSPSGDLTPTPTPTVLSPPGDLTPTPTSSPSPCDSLSGAIELQVLVGPADAVGLEPFAVGSVSFTVVGGTVQGADHITYQDILIEDWGTYEVTLDLDITISGECEEAGLNVTLDLAGSQYVEVKAEGFHGQYPWQGEHSFYLTFPLQDGATVQGEGWVFVLRLPSL